MAFKLYNAPQSTCSQRVRFVFNSKKLPFEEVKLNLLEGDQLKPDYLKLNPNGVVPTLDHDGAIIIDSTVIIEYLDEIAPNESFTPENPVERARMRCSHAFHRRNAGCCSSGANLQSGLPAEISEDEPRGLCRNGRV